MENNGLKYKKIKLEQAIKIVDEYLDDQLNSDIKKIELIGELSSLDKFKKILSSSSTIEVYPSVLNDQLFSQPPSFRVEIIDLISSFNISNPNFNKFCYQYLVLNHQIYWNLLYFVDRNKTGLRKLKKMETYDKDFSYGRKAHDLSNIPKHYALALDEIFKINFGLSNYELIVEIFQRNFDKFDYSEFNIFQYLNDRNEYLK